MHNSVPSLDLTCCICFILSIAQGLKVECFTGEICNGTQVKKYFINIDLQRVVFFFFFLLT